MSPGRSNGRTISQRTRRSVAHASESVGGWVGAGDQCVIARLGPGVFGGGIARAVGERAPPVPHLPQLDREVHPRAPGALKRKNYQPAHGSGRSTRSGVGGGGGGGGGGGPGAT